jgi:hypothetical protein
MHDIDRTNLESTYGEYAGEYAAEDSEQYAGEYAGEYQDEYATGEFEAEFEGGYDAAGEAETYGEYSQEGTFSEADEMELAAELLSVSNEAELDQFLGKLFKKAGAFVSSTLGQDLMNKLKGLAGQALPLLGSAIGNMVVPGAGGVVGGKLAGSMLGLELEGLSYEDQEFEVAKQIVRLSGEAARTAAQAGEYGPPAQVAHEAFAAAAQRYAPGLRRNRRPRYSSSRRGHRCSQCGNSGRWVRRGNAILLLGV